MKIYFFRLEYRLKHRRERLSGNVKTLNVSDITSTVYTIAPTQIEYIAHLFGDKVADTMNLRNFATKIRAIAEQALTEALTSAKHQGENRQKIN